MREVSLSLPERHHELAGQVLATGITLAEERGMPIGAAVAEAARAAGHRLGSPHRGPGHADPAGPAVTDAIVDVLRLAGYEPGVEAKTTRLANCPSHRLSQGHTQLVCGMNLYLISGVVEASGATGLHPRLDPVEGQCCVAIDLPA